MAIVVDTNNSGIDLSAQKDPMLLLLLNSTLTQNLELQIQGGASQVLQSWSEGATANINAGDQDLINQANAMTAYADNPVNQKDKDFAAKLATMQAQYNTSQTKYSNLNNQYSNVMQGGGTIVTNLTQVEQQALQLCQVTVDFQNSTNQLITQWGS